MKVFYFDRNVYDWLRKRHKVTDAEVQMLVEAVQSSKIHIMVSDSNYNETIPVISPEEKRLLTKLGGEVIWHWKSLVGYDVIFFAFNMSPLPRYSFEVSKGELDEFIDKTLYDKALADGIIEGIVTENIKYGDSLRNIATPKPEKNPPTLAEYFNRYAPYVAEMVAERFSVLEFCRHRGIDGLLAVPSVRAFVGILISIRYAKDYKGTKGYNSDGFDITHAVYASVADIFVTNDERLLDRLREIPALSYEVINLRTLLDRIHAGYY
jgi:hypothetical protein